MNRSWALSALAYVAITCAMGHRVLASLGTAVASDAGDPVLNAAILAWNAQQLPWTDAWFQFPIFYPTPDALTLSEHLLGVSVIATPIYQVTGNAAIAYNLTLLLTYPLSGLAMYALVWRLTRTSSAAFLAGLAFAFAPYRASQLPHIQMLTVFWAPLALLGLHGFVGASVRLKPDSTNDDAENGRSVRLQADWQGGLQADRQGWWRWLALFAVCWALQGAANGYLLVHFSVLVGLWVAWFLVARRRWRDAGLVVAACAAALLPLVPILYRYMVAHRQLGLTRNLGEIASFGADIAAPLCASDRLTLWGWLRVACAPEGELFAGAALVAVCIAGLLSGGRREPRHEPRKRPPSPVGFGAQADGACPPTWSARHASRPGSADLRSASGGPPWRRRVSAVRGVIRRVAIAIAIVFVAVTVSVFVVGPWRLDLGWIRASASSADKPTSTALAFLLVAFVLSDQFRTAVARGSVATFYAGAAIVCWVLSWGPFPRFLGADILYQAPYAWLLQFPGVGGLRVPARFWMMTVLCLSVLAGLAVAALLRGRTGRAPAAVVVMVACAFLIDGWTTIPVAAIPPPLADAQSLRGAPVLALPVGELERDVGVVYHAVAGGWRSINGFSGYEPGYYEALRTLSRAGDRALVDPFVRLADVHVVDEGGRHRLASRPGANASSPLGQRLNVRARDASCSPDSLAGASDGDVETSWVCGVQNADHEITFALGQLADVGAIVHGLGSRGADFPRHLLVETSADGTQWELAWEGSPAAAVLVAAMDAPRLTRVVIPFTPRAAQYVRLRQTGRHERNYWSIAELEVWSGT